MSYEDLERQDMTIWAGCETGRSTEALFAVERIVEETTPDVLVEVGAPNAGLVAFLRAIHPGAALFSPSGESVGATPCADRPDGALVDVLAAGRAVVVLTDPTPATAFAWASALAPRSRLVVFDGGDRWPDWSAADCQPDPTWVFAPDRAFVLLRVTAAPSSPGAIVRRPPPQWPLRSVFLGDLRYCSAYRLGIGQAVARLGGLHRDVDIRGEGPLIDRQIEEMRPDIVWTHMLLWAPSGSPSVSDLLGLAEGWRRRGAIVLLHDGDPRARTRFPHDVSRAVDAALLNHSRSVAEWGVPTIYWPYAAFMQSHRAAPVPEFRADLVFGGILREEGPLYGPRTACVRMLRDRLGARIFPDETGFNTRLMTAEVAASCIAVVGFGRPEVPGWIDTRVFQYPGAGAILLHDDVHPEFTGLVPDVHYIQVPRYDVDAIGAALGRLRATSEPQREAMREAAFRHIQGRHTWVHRVQTVLGTFFNGGAL